MVARMVVPGLALGEPSGPGGAGACALCSMVCR